jgi:hypothetical protein
MISFKLRPIFSRSRLEGSVCISSYLEEKKKRFQPLQVIESHLCNQYCFHCILLGSLLLLVLLLLPQREINEDNLCSYAELFKSFRITAGNCCNGLSSGFIYWKEKRNGRAPATDRGGCSSLIYRDVQVSSPMRPRALAQLFVHSALW